MTPEKMFHELHGLGLKWEVVECEPNRKSSKVSKGEIGRKPISVELKTDSLDQPAESAVGSGKDQGRAGGSGIEET